MFKDLGCMEGMLLFTHFRIPKQSLDYGLLPLMSEEDVIKFLKYVPRLREVEVYIETNFSFVEKHLMERMTSKGKAVLIEEIVDHDVNDVVGNELDADSRNSGKIPLVTFNQTSHVGKDGTIVAIDFCVCDYDDEFLPPWSTEKMLEDRTRRRSDEFEFKKLLAEINHEFRLDNSSQDGQDVSNDVDFDDAIFNDVSFDDVDFDWRKTIFAMVTTMGIRHMKTHTLRGEVFNETRVEVRLGQI
nr:hypothetical protein [Tanacetum cinerariifolium]